MKVFSTPSWIRGQNGRLMRKRKCLQKGKKKVKNWITTNENGSKTPLDYINQVRINQKKFKRNIKNITCEDVPIQNHEATHAWIT